MRRILFCAAALFVLAVVSPASAVTTAFTYQGKLTDGSGKPLTGLYDLSLKLFDAQTDGNQVGSTILLPQVPVSDGLFTAELDFGGTAFITGNARWLETAVGATTLTPRVRITAVPMAAFSAAPWVTTGSDINYDLGHVGIGVEAPTEKLDVRGTVKMTGLKLPTGAEQGYVLTSDAAGRATWKAPPAPLAPSLPAVQPLRRLITAPAAVAVNVHPETRSILLGASFGGKSLVEYCHDNAIPLTLDIPAGELNSPDRLTTDDVRDLYLKGCEIAAYPWSSSTILSAQAEMAADIRRTKAYWDSATDTSGRRLPCTVRGWMDGGCWDGGEFITGEADDGEASRALRELFDYSTLIEAKLGGLPSHTIQASPHFTPRSWLSFLAQDAAQATALGKALATPGLISVIYFHDFDDPVPAAALLAELIQQRSAGNVALVTAHTALTGALSMSGIPAYGGLVDAGYELMDIPHGDSPGFGWRSKDEGDGSVVRSTSNPLTGNSSALVTVPTDSDLQLMQAMNVIPGEIYAVKFRVRASRPDQQIALQVSFPVSDSPNDVSVLAISPTSVGSTEPVTFRAVFGVPLNAEGRCNITLVVGRMLGGSATVQIDDWRLLPC